MAKNIKESTMNSFYSGDYKEFKDAINGEILNRVGDHIDQISSEIANELVYGSEDSDDEAEDEESDEIKESKKDDDDDDQRGGEYILDISFPDGQEGTALKNFRVSAISKSDALLRCEKMFGKGKFNVSSIKYYDFGDPINPAGAGKTGKAVKEEVENLGESARLLKTYSNGNRTAKVYKDNEWQEHRVKYFTDGNHHKEADSFHDHDKDGALDAHTGAQHFVNKTGPYSDKKMKESFIDEIEAAFPVKKESPEDKKKEKKAEKILKKLKKKKVDED